MSEHLIDRALLEPVGRSGRFQRQPSTFRDWKTCGRPVTESPYCTPAYVGVADELVEASYTFESLVA